MPTITRAHCNACGDDRNHAVIHAESEDWESDGHTGNDTYEMLRCGGCESVRLRHIARYSVGDGERTDVQYFPPTEYRKPPAWFREFLVAGHQNGSPSLSQLMIEIYAAVRNNLPSLAAMGIRSLLERIMISKTGDQGTFQKNLTMFESLGHVSKKQREHLETILDAGHAAIHRSYVPSTADVVTLLEITEHVVESVFMHEQKIARIKEKVPPRKRGGA
jgi:hypothetical protein